MLEEWAHEYVNQTQGNLHALDYGLTILGGVIAGITNRSRSEITRAPYFAYSAAIFFLVSAAQIVWLQSVPAVLGGYLWVLMALSVGATIIGGFFYGKIAMARSRDAYGHGRMAALAFIPFANLWLLLTPSKNTLSPQRIPAVPLVRGGWGVILGFVLLAAGKALTAFLEHEADRLVSQAESDPLSQERSIEILVRTRGLEEALHLMAAQAQLPIRVDEVTTLSRIEAQGTQLRRTYVVALQDAMLNAQFRAGSTNSICAHAPFLPLFRAGATIREVYVKSNSSPIGAILITRDDCGL
jgi:hypothetical protein